MSDILHSSIFRELIDCIDDLVLILDPGLHVVKANRSAIVCLGYAESEFMGMKLSLLVEKGERSKIAKLVRELMERRGGEVILRTKAHRKILLLFSLSPIADAGEKPHGYLLTGRLSGEMDASRVSEATNGLAERMLKGFADPLSIIDGSSRTVLDCNGTALTLFGYTREELVGWRLLGHAASEEERERNEALMERASKAYATSGIFKERLLFHRKNGPALPCDFIGLPFFKPDGSLSFILALLFDRSSEEDREAELAVLLDRVRSLASDLAAAVDCPECVETRRLSALGFTSRQIEIARLIALGVSSKDIGFRLGIAESTVRNHLAVMFRKLGVTTRIGFMHVLTEQRIRIA